jgi:hypothetical protein
MQRFFTLALATLLITSATAAFAADNSVGTWKLNVEKSKYSPAPFPVKSITATREAADNGIKVTNTGERADGSPINSTYTAKYDGSDSAVSGQGSPYDSVSIKQVNANTFNYEAKNSASKYHVRGKITVSSDGKTLTFKAKGMNGDGKPMSVTLVYDKQ